mgnify:CR=1 FL=1
MTQYCAQAAGKGETGFGIDLDLIDAGQMDLDGVSDGDDVELGLADLAQGGVKGGGLAAAGRAGDEDDAGGTFEDAVVNAAVIIVHAEIFHSLELIAQAA